MQKTKAWQYSDSRLGQGCGTGLDVFDETNEILWQRRREVKDYIHMRGGSIVGNNQGSGKTSDRWHKRKGKWPETRGELLFKIKHEIHQTENPKTGQSSPRCDKIVWSWSAPCRHSVCSWLLTWLGAEGFGMFKGESMASSSARHTCQCTCMSAHYYIGHLCRLRHQFWAELICNHKSTLSPEGQAYWKG